MAQNPINSAAIPSVDLDAAALQAATEKLRKNATALWQRGSDVKSAWSGLAHVYEAPESATLLSAMDPVATHTEKFSGDAYMVVSALNEFAAEAGPLVATLKKTKFDAAMFETRMRGKDDWDHDEKLVNENNDLVHAVNTTVVAFQAAERKAANAIENVIGGHTFHAMDPNAEHQDKYAYGFDSIPDDAKTPWGAKVEKKDGCFASTMTHIGHFFKGVGEGLWGMVKGVGLLVWNGLGAGGWEKFKQTWKGLGTMALMLNPALATAVWGPKGYADRMAAMGKSLVHWDEWKKDPSQAAGMVFADVITTVGTGGAGAGAKGAAVTGEVVETAGKLGKAGEVAGDASKLSKAGGLTKAALTTLGKTVDPATYLRTLGKIPKIGQVMGGLKVKLTDLTGLGGKSPVDQMAVAGHGHAAAAGGEMGGKGLHDVTNTVKHPDPVPPVREPATVGGGGHEAGSAGSHPSTGGHDTGSGGSHPVSHGGSSHPGGHDGPPTPHDGAPTSHDGAPTSHDGAPTSHDGAPGPHDGAPGPHDGAPGPHDGAPGPHDGAPGPHDGAPGPHDGAPGPHDGAPGPHDGTPAPHDGTPAPHDGTPAPHDGTHAPHDAPGSGRKPFWQIKHEQAHLESMGTHGPIRTDDLAHLVPRKVNPVRVALDNLRLSSHEKGVLGEALTRHAINRQGLEIVGEQVPIRVGGHDLRVDFLVRDTHGDVFVVDSKFGKNAVFTDNQVAAYPGLAAHGGRFELGTGPVAERAGAELGTNRELAGVQVMRWNRSAGGLAATRDGVNSVIHELRDLEGTRGFTATQKALLSKLTTHHDMRLPVG